MPTCRRWPSRTCHDLPPRRRSWTRTRSRRHGARRGLCSASPDADPLDEAAASILAQLLGKHGLGAEIVPHDRVSRRGIESLDLSGVVMVCIAYLEVKGNPSHLRYLLQRLRERLPHGKLLVGLWPQQETVLSDTALQREIGADVYVSTLLQSVEACIAETQSNVQQVDELV